MYVMHVCIVMNELEWKQIRIHFIDFIDRSIVLKVLRMATALGELDRNAPF